ncbi:hypothetical protein [Aeromonas sobria]|uniref:hypothetical protein n=1 Tax=Aeromonas sobria TaxID=646 RepID=UPI003D092C4C
MIQLFALCHSFETSLELLIDISHRERTLEINRHAKVGTQKNKVCIVPSLFVIDTPSHRGRTATETFLPFGVLIAMPKPRGGITPDRRIKKLSP